MRWIARNWQRLLPFALAAVALTSAVVAGVPGTTDLGWHYPPPQS
jgi:hypothetical protein